MSDQSSSTPSGQFAWLRRPSPCQETRSYKVQIDDLPEETISASNEADLADILRVALLSPSFDHVGNDVHVTIVRPDGSTSTSTVAEQREAYRATSEPMSRTRTPPA